MLQITPADVILHVLYVDIVPYMLVYSKPVFVANTVDPDQTKSSLVQVHNVCLYRELSH